MAHELSEVEGIVEMAYLLSDGIPWHNKGQAIEDKDKNDISVWADATRMNKWRYESAPVLYWDEVEREVKALENKVVAVRSDTRKAMDVVGVNYQFHQPAEVMDFFDRIVKGLGYYMTSAGVLFDGKQFWCQAFSGNSRKIGGIDQVNESIAITTGFNGSTKGIKDTCRIVCNNTLQMALKGGKKVSMSHSSAFDSSEMIRLLSLQDGDFSEWADIADRMASIEMTDGNSIDFFANVFELYTSEESELPIAERIQIAADNKTVMSVFDLFNGNGIGSSMKSADGTLWGAVNAVTEYVDHHRATQTWDNRFASAQFGSWAKVKTSAWDKAMMLAA